TGFSASISAQKARPMTIVVLSDGKILVSGEVLLDNSFPAGSIKSEWLLDNIFGNGGSVRAYGDERGACRSSRHRNSAGRENRGGGVFI
ncbi:MAG TPA: hypothetical protein VFD48_14015, partial [Pyrinomonadaceae bacterium]|nr:hypothetical protein [Pyrinomonadaceae bacterium]